MRLLMSKSYVRFRSLSGEIMFAFTPATDPLEVLVELAWAWRDGQIVCDLAGETHPDTYCVECHSIAWAALTEAKRSEGLLMSNRHD